MRINSTPNDGSTDEGDLERPMPGCTLTCSFSPSRLSYNLLTHAISDNLCRMTFFGGTRGCIGFRFALSELQITLTELVRQFYFELPSDVRIRKELALVTLPVVEGDPSRQQRMPLRVSVVDVNSETM
jgi:cytochrome P450